MMPYRDEEDNRKRVTKRYARRFVYVASFLVFLLIFGIIWHTGDTISKLVTHTRPNGTIVYQDGTPYYVLALLLVIWPIVHTVYLLYQEMLEQALEREMAKANAAGDQYVPDSVYGHLAEDGEWLDTKVDEKPKRRPSYNRRDPSI